MALSNLSYLQGRGWTQKTSCFSWTCPACPACPTLSLYKEEEEEERERERERKVERPFMDRLDNSTISKT
jgi:hypothetical protein